MKMKKRLLILLAAAALLLPACQGGDAAPAPRPALREAVESAVGNPEALVPNTAEDLFDLMGIGPEAYTEAVFLMDRDSLSGREYIAVRARDEAALRDVAARLSRYLAQRMEETRNYLPDAYRLQSAAQVETKGLTAVLFIDQQAAEKTKAFLSGE